MAAEGGQLVQPLVAGVGPVPVESPLLRLAERARLPYPVGRLGAQRQVPVRAGHPTLIDRRVGQRPAVDRGEDFTHVGRGPEAEAVHKVVTTVIAGVVREPQR
jgi:hypothetical protein